MDAREAILWGCTALASTGASADVVEWTRRGAVPASEPLVCEISGKITDRQTRGEIIARYPGLSGNMQAIAERIGQMRAAGYDVRGSGSDQTLSIVLPYRIVYSGRLQFGVRVDQEAMTTRVAWLDGRVEATTNRKALPYLTPANAARLREIRSEFERVRNDEIQAVRAWNERRHPWTGDELARTNRVTDGVFQRDLGYRFCKKAHRVEFKAAWRGSLGVQRRSRS